MLWDVVSGFSRWLRAERTEVGRRVEHVEAAIAEVLPPAAALRQVSVEGPLPSLAKAAQPFWTAAGVRGILSARRPCVLPDLPDLESAIAAPLPQLAPVVTAAVPRPAAAETPPVAAPRLADRLRQVRESNRPVRVVPGLKRQARDVLAGSVPPAAKAAAPRASVTEMASTDDPFAQALRRHPVLAFAA
jgi:hypothetical protein